MQRVVSHQYTQLIEAGFDLIPKAIADRLRHIHFFTGTDPIYAGLKYGGDEETTKDGRSYRATWCCSYPWNQAVEDKRTTIIMTDLQLEYPKALRPVMVVHELGHCLHEVLDFEPYPRPVTKYAQHDKWEAFAEAFTLWLFPSYGQYYRIIEEIDEKTRALFSQLIIGR